MCIVDTNAELTAKFLGNSVQIFSGDIFLVLCQCPVAIFCHCENDFFVGTALCVKFCFRLWNTVTETYVMLKEALGDEAMS